MPCIPMFLIPLAVLILFKYIPMYGAQIAFRNYKPTRGKVESEWVGEMVSKIF